MEKCLILGASGFIGKNLVKKLAESYTVIAYSKMPTKDFDQLDNVIQIIGDFRYEKWEPILDEVSVIFHLISTTIPIESTVKIINEIEDNIVPTVRFLEVIKDMPIKKFIFISSGGTIYGDMRDLPFIEDSKPCPISSYGVQKQVIENYINFYHMKYHLPTCIARVSNPYGLGSDLTKPQGIIPIFLNKVLSDETIIVWGDGEVIRDYIYMEDLIEVLMILIEYKGDFNTFNIGTGIGHSINYIISLIFQITGNSCEVVYSKSRDSDVRKNILDISRVKKALNWQPTTTLPEGIKKLCDQFSQLKCLKTY